ncbi:serine protease inhibitor 28Dc [Teleopsis dalmanni]|uniref:serine protease inhibitor 28Dc n=1 Tax=Teleopsis dalmanni TaxID=139649 RepID=UPI0018CD13B0|nr:serine protease inhibitor 28Dc [Teleopsis dalmanni]
MAYFGIYQLQLLVCVALVAFCIAETQINLSQIIRDTPFNKHVTQQLQNTGDDQSALAQNTQNVPSTLIQGTTLNGPPAPPTHNVRPQLNHNGRPALTQKGSPALTYYTDPAITTNVVQNSKPVSPPVPPPPAISPQPSAYPHSIPSKPYELTLSDKIALNILGFANDIGQQLNNNAYSSKCEVFSPLSIMSALALLMLGAKGKSYQELAALFGIYYDAEFARDTSKFHDEFAQMLEDLQWPDQYSLRDRLNAAWKSTGSNSRKKQSNNNKANRPTEHIIRVANGLFTQSGYSLNPDYSNIVKSVYHSELEPLDFNGRSGEARNFINAWVNSRTFGKIRNIVHGDLPKDTNVIIASTLYFKGFWETPFFAAVTVSDDFYPDGPDGPSVKVPMMGTGGVLPFYDAVEYDCRIIGLPYVGNVTTMYVIQPNYSTRLKLRQFLSTLDAQKIEDMISRMTLKTAVLALPKMHFSRSLNIKDMLYRMNVNDIFVSGQSDLSLISNDQITYSVSQQQTPTSQVQSHVQSSVPQPQPVRDNNRNTFVFSPTVDNGNGNSGLIRNAKQNSRPKRDVADPKIKRSFVNLETERNTQRSTKSNLFVEDIVHKVDFDVNEYGTEAAAATLTYLRRSGTDVHFRADAPFLLLIRHDPTKLPLFYAIINEPES